MSISQNFPSTRPSLNLNFARSKTLDPRITFTRTSSATYVDDNGYIVTAGANEPRFDHDPVTGESLGLLIEESRVNNYHVWNSTTDTATNLNSAFIDTQIVSSVLTPRGVTATAYTATKTGNTEQYHGLGGGANSFSISSNTSISASAYIKDFNNSDYRLYFVIAAYNASTDNRRYILYRARPSTGEWISGAVHSNWSTPVTDVKDVGNGWYRFEISSTNTYEAGWDVIQFFFQLLNENNAQFYDPPTANTHGLYLSSPQFELGNFPTSYIPTSGSTATRTPDNAKIEGTNFSNWYNPNEGSVYAKFSRVPLVSTNIFSFSDGTLLNRTNYRHDTDGTTVSLINVVNNITNAFPAVILNSGLIKIITSSIKTNDYIISSNGNLGGSDTDVSIPSVNQFGIGQVAGVSHYNGTISQLTYYPSRLSNQQLINLTK